MLLGGGSGDPYAQWVGMQISVVSMKTNMEIPQKKKK
jgi:hypothetical protein